MSLKCQSNSLENVLRRFYTSPHRLCLFKNRYSTLTPSLFQFTAQINQDVAILGGGITGLASAFYLSSIDPHTKVTLYESGPRLGGWLHSTSVDVGNGKVVFEQGPRNLRPSVPNGLVTLDLIRQLDMQNEILMTSKNSVAAQNRFVYYPDHLVCMPGPNRFWENVRTMLTEPVFRGFVSGLLKEPLKMKPQGLSDESVGDFITRRFGAPIADNIVSAVMHGIYAGDIYQLSARSILPKQWKHEIVHESVLLGGISEALSSNPVVPIRDQILLEELKQRMPTKDGKASPGYETIEEASKSSVFTFKQGIGELATRLEDALESKPNVTIRKNTPIESLRLVLQENTSKIQVTSSGKSHSVGYTEAVYSHVISTISGKTLSDLVQPPGSLAVLAKTPSVTVMVVNLFFSNPDLLLVHGFGYLLPRSLPFEQNPERALGVIFDSDATIGQDNVPGTKLTVMLGGHWWDGWDTYPDEEEGANMARAVLARHLKIVEEPQTIRVSLQKNCIPQYTVGHVDRMSTANQALEQRFHGKLRVAGNSYTGVGLNDCVRAARDVATSVYTRVGGTGLEHFVRGE